MLSLLKFHRSPNKITDRLETTEKFHSTLEETTLSRFLPLPKTKTQNKDISLYLCVL